MWLTLLQTQQEEHQVRVGLRGRRHADPEGTQEQLPGVSRGLPCIMFLFNIGQPKSPVMLLPIWKDVTQEFKMYITISTISQCTMYLDTIRHALIRMVYGRHSLSKLTGEDNLDLKMALELHISLLWRPIVSEDVKHA